MAQDWEKLAGEKGEEIPKGRFQRLLTLGKMGARVTASTLANKASTLLPMGSQSSRDARMQRAYEDNAARVVEALGQLKGASMKIGQLLSADPELVPDGFGEMLSSLQNQAPPMTWRTIKEQLEKAYDLPMEVVFREFDPDPVGSASIGQVHLATLDSGERVAVKIQYPGVIDALESDLQSLGMMLVYGRAMIDKARLDAYLAEIREMILQESDYEAEGRNLERFQAILSEREGVRAPKPFMEWTRKSVLVMEYIEGTKLDDALRAMEEGEARQGLIWKWVETYTWMFHELHEIHADPHPGNFLLEPDGTLAILDFGSVKKFSPEFADGILDILDTVWLDEPERAIPMYQKMGFGKAGFDFDKLEPQILAEYHEIVLAPFLRNEPFEFSTWKPSMEANRFMLRNPIMLGLVPPAEAIPYFRMLSGIKGLLGKLDARVNVCGEAIETARRRGRLTQEPYL